MTQEGLKNTLFLDVQTSSAQPSYKELDPEWQALWNDQIFKDEDIVKLTPAERYSERAALRAEFATVVTVSLGALLFSGSEPYLHVRAITGTEKDILTKIASASEKFNRIVAHSGKTFDIPTLGKRYLANGLSVPKLFDVRGQKPWEVLHQDLQDLWRFGDSSWPSLNLLCKVLNIDSTKVTDATGKEIQAEDIPKIYWLGTDTAKKNITDFSANEVVRTAKVYIKLQEPNLLLSKFQIA